MHCYRAFSNLIYSTANTLVTVCNKLLIQTTIFCTYNVGENSFCLESFSASCPLFLVHFDTCLQGCLVTLGKLLDGKVPHNVLSVRALRQ